MPTKVLSLIHSYFNRAGTELHAKMLADSLESFCITKFVVSDGQNLYQVEQNDSKLDEVKSTILDYPKTPINSKVHEEYLINSIKSFNADIIHIHHLLNWPLSVVDLLIESKIPYIISLHDYYYITADFTLIRGMDFSKCTSANYSLKVFGSDISDYLIKRREIFIKLLNHAKVIISPSRFTKGIYQSVFSEKVKVISHGIKEIEISKNQELTNSFGYIGSFLPQKGISLLLDAFDIYRQNGGKFELKLFGGNLDNNLNNIDGLSQYGVYNTSDLPKICSKFDIGIIPSIFPESFCLTLSELWSMKKPVICSSIGALKERIFDNPKGGILFGITNVNNLVEALFMAEKNSAKFVNEFSAQTDSLEKMANTYREIYVS